MVKLITNNILLAKIQQDRLLIQYNTIIIDKAHKHSLNINFLLSYLKKLLPQHPNLKIIITSATINPKHFSRHFNNAPIIKVSGRTYPVKMHYQPIVKKANNTKRNQLQAIFDAINKLSQKSPGNILIFINGKQKIRNTANTLNKLNLRHTKILPLYAQLSNSKQNRIFQSHSERHIMLATNIAKTSLTIPEIKYIINPDTAHISRYNYHTKVQHLPIKPISQASANQHKGRYGHMSKRIYIHLYSKDNFLSRPKFTNPKILHTNLASIILQITTLELGNIATFPFVKAPNKHNIQNSMHLLKKLGAITTNKQASAYKLTPLDRQLSQLPINPRLAHIMLKAQKHGCMHKAIIITSTLSIQDPRKRPINKQQASNKKHHRFHNKESNFLAFINL